jgi:hypothetical protein
MENQNLDLEYQYQLYLKRAALDESLMGEVQKKETRQAFMGACGQMLILLQEDIGKMDVDAGVEAMVGMLDQVDEYFNKIVKG